LALLLGLSGLFWQSGRTASDPQTQEAAVVSPPALPPATPNAEPAPQQAGLVTANEPAEAPLDIRLSADGTEDGDEEEGDRPQTDKKKKDKSPEPTFSEAENRQMAKRYLDEAENSGAYVIMVGSFAHAGNARRLSEKLLKEGYTPFSDTQKGLQRVGVRLNCSESELKRHLAKIRGKVNKGAWVLDR
jgi:cell division septation protein DedD